MATEDKRIDQLDPVSVLDLTSLMAMQQGTNAKKVTLQQLLDYLNGQIDTGNAVLFVSQNLSDAQKLQARTNIGAAAPGEGGGSVEGSVLYTVQNLTPGQQHQARKNIRCGSVGEVDINCKAYGGYSHAEGYATKATSYYSHAEGKETEATDVGSHAEGDRSIASGICAHAEGEVTEAAGIGSHAEGKGTVAKGNHQHVQGRYNKEDLEERYAHIIGNGYYDYYTSEAVRSNAHTLDWAGVPWFAGDRVMLGGTGMDDEAAVELMPVFVPQEWTEEQQAQARANIGVDTYIEQVFLGGEW